MNIELYNKYGNYYGRYFIVNYEKLDEFLRGKTDREILWRIRSRYLWMLFPFIGIILIGESFSEIGLDIL